MCIRHEPTVPAAILAGGTEVSEAPLTVHDRESVGDATKDGFQLEVRTPQRFSFFFMAVIARARCKCAQISGVRSFVRSTSSSRRS